MQLTVANRYKKNQIVNNAESKKLNSNGVKRGKNMNKFKKLVPAICMLLVSAVLMGTSTFAWFSMNTTVTAKGMQVTAKSDSKFLQIITTGEFSDSTDQIEATAANASKQVRPTVAMKAGTPDTTLVALTKTDSASVIKWGEAFSRDPASSTKNGDIKDVTTLATAADTTNIYTLINDYKVRLNPKTGATTAENLTVGSVTVTSTKTDTANDVMKDAVRVLIVCGENWTIWKNGSKVLAKGDSNIIASEVTTTATDIKVYVYFDGEDTLTTTNNAAKLGTDGYNVEFTLTIA